MSSCSISLAEPDSPSESLAPQCSMARRSAFGQRPGAGHALHVHEYTIVRYEARPAMAGQRL